MINTKDDDATQETFAILPQIMEDYETRFWRVEQSELYKPAGVIAPKLPLYHPYHPFTNVTNGYDLPQVPLATKFDNYTDVAPHHLLDMVSAINPTEVQTFFVVQSLPYLPGIPVIARYQYGVFPDAKSEMKGFQSIWAQGIVFDHKSEAISKLPPTKIKIYESTKNELSPTILCGNTMKLDVVENLKGRGVWSLVVSSENGEVGDDGLFINKCRVFVGYTHFLEDDDEYNNVLEFLRRKSPREFLGCIPSLIEMGFSQNILDIV
mmetsp:Transcript_17851/g.37286  ORF Transcript_17851/g.37286 Transcript_17851/m.37286 type:complete len:265 (+) Transcript_17851:83-877(+)